MSDERLWLALLLLFAAGVAGLVVATGLMLGWRWALLVASVSAIVVALAAGQELG